VRVARRALTKNSQRPRDPQPSVDSNSNSAKNPAHPEPPVARGTRFSKTLDFPMIWASEFHSVF
jgi:hypothetical protein